MPFEHVKEVNPKRYNELIEFMPFIQSFNIFMMAKQIGISFRPTDLDIEHVAVFSFMHERLEKRAKDGRQ